MARKQNQTITQLAKNIQSLARTAVTAYEREFEEIIGSRCREKCRIERALDGMLDFCFDKNMLEMYRKLCRYYYDIDRNAAAEYVLAYRDMREPEDSGKRIKRSSASERGSRLRRSGFMYEERIKNGKN